MEQFDFLTSDETTPESLGQIAVRVVVFKKTFEQVPEKLGVETIEEEEEFADADKEISGYLESSTRGKLHVVFLLSGQRHHCLDRSFIVNELGKKYISKRTLIVVELEGLTREAKSQLIQGSRSGFYEAGVFERIRARLVALLKKDPDLERLEEEAEEDLTKLQASDEAVNKALDELIEEHNPFAERSTEGQSESGVVGEKVLSSSGKPRKLEVIVNGENGPIAVGPVLIGRNAPKTLRLRPNQPKEVIISSQPPEAWSQLGKIGWVMDPPLDELKITLEPAQDGAHISLLYSSRNEEEEFPVETKLLLFASFKGEEEPRLFEQNVVIRPPAELVPKTPPDLQDEPTELSLRTRKPIRLIIGEADRHVMFQWNGKDDLLAGALPAWSLKVFSTSHPNYPKVAVTQPSGGRFQAVIACPRDTTVYAPGTAIIFRAEAESRSGKILSIAFEVSVEQLKDILPEIGPRRLSTMLPFGSKRKPDYRVVVISEADYGTTDCPWSNSWDGNLAGAYIGSTERAPLTLIINADYNIYRSFIDSEVASKNSETSIKRQRTRYCAHLCYYLYQMHLAQASFPKDVLTSDVESPEATLVGDPTDARNVQEVNRVGRMLVRLMETMR